MQGFFVDESSLVGARLREERLRLGLSQAEAGAIAGVSREMWGRYEKGALPGGEVFLALGKSEVDILYILTGERSHPVPPQDLLPEGDRIFLDNLHAAPVEVQRGVKITLDAFAPRRSKAGDHHRGHRKSA